MLCKLYVDTQNAFKEEKNLILTRFLFSTVLLMRSHLFDVLQESFLFPPENADEDTIKQYRTTARFIITGSVNVNISGASSVQFVDYYGWKNTNLRIYKSYTTHNDNNKEISIEPLYVITTEKAYQKYCKTSLEHISLISNILIKDFHGCVFQPLSLLGTGRLADYER